MHPKISRPLTPSPASSLIAVAMIPHVDNPSSANASSSASAPDIVQAGRSSTMTRVPSCPTGLPAASPPTDASSTTSRVSSGMLTSFF
ncbi:hypothetical protein SDC9_152792 [bioreactor metagenome]|uniref:Uncharacterized protein n=1 Tax=bioreactor metagenome TaxID=1076179 RepID=A0A645EU35_9ZZZZ